MPPSKGKCLHVSLLNRKGQFYRSKRSILHEEYGIFEESMHFYIFYCLCFGKEITVGMLKGKLRVERDPDLEVEEYVSLLGYIENH